MEVAKRMRKARRQEAVAKAPAEDDGSHWSSATSLPAMRSCFVPGSVLLELARGLFEDETE
ncbi:MAG: hypothetical protein ACLTDR_04800 [Adlercreutzia equolifaciens]